MSISIKLSKSSLLGLLLLLQAALHYQQHTYSAQAAAIRYPRDDHLLQIPRDPARKEEWRGRGDYAKRQESSMADGLLGLSDTSLTSTDDVILEQLAASDVSTTSASTSILPWCSGLPSLTSTSTSSLPAASSTSGLDTATISTSTTTTSGLYTSSSAGLAICIALSSSISSSVPSSASPLTSAIDDGSDGSTTTSLTSIPQAVQTIIISPSRSITSLASTTASSSPRARSTVTVTAVQETYQRAASPSTSIVEVTQTVWVYSTTTNLQTFYTTITPRPTAAFLTGS